MGSPKVSLPTLMTLMSKDIIIIRGVCKHVEHGVASAVHAVKWGSGV